MFSRLWSFLNIYKWNTFSFLSHRYNVCKLEGLKLVAFVSKCIYFKVKVLLYNGETIIYYISYMKSALNIICNALNYLMFYYE